MASRSRVSWLTVVAALASALIAVAFPGAGAQAKQLRDTGAVLTSDAEPGYVSLLLGRANWSVASGTDCQTRYSGALTMEDIAQDLSSRGVTATAQAVVTRTLETTRFCQGYVEMASWQDLRRMQDVYGWSVTSQGMTYADMTQMTSDEQRFQESAATVAIFAAHGFPRAWGSFAFANNKQDPAALALVQKYFGFLRIYGMQPNTRPSATTAPFRMLTWSINGGRCRNPSLPCATMAVTANRQMAERTRLQAAMNPAPGEWSVIQIYRLVQGRQGRIGDKFAWDCEASDWRDRWTSQPEIYCRTSFLEALDGRCRTAIFTDPATMAQLWDRVPEDYLGWPRP